MTDPEGARTGRTWVLRADASSQAGIGHVMRTLTLASAALRRGWRCQLWSADIPPALRARARRLGIEVVDVSAEPGSRADGEALAGVGADRITLDGYHLGAELVEGIGPDPVLLRIDDNGEQARVRADAILNQNPHAATVDYGSSGALIHLRGLRYALIRPEITNQFGLATPTRGAPRRVLVSMGGADPAGATRTILDGLSDLPIAVEVVIGLANPGAEDLRDLIGASPTFEEVGSEDLPAALATADLAVLAAGTTLWEAACLGTPVVAVATADNQRQLVETPEVRSFCTIRDARRHDLGSAAALDVQRLVADDALRCVMGEAGQALVDGNGADRVIDAIDAIDPGDDG